MIEPQQILEVAIAGPKVRVSGQVTLNEKPSRGWRLDFSRPQGGGHARGTTDDLGAYEIVLDRAGEYYVTVSGDGLLEMTAIRVTEGENTRDLAFKKSAVLVARVDGIEPGVPVTGELREIDGSERFSTKTLESGENELKWVLPFGTYAVSARQVSRTSETVTVLLDNHQREAAVTLDLKEVISNIIIRDEDGNPVSDAKFRLVFPAPVELAPGTYSLEAVSPGTLLRIRARADLVPTCRVAPRNDTIEVVLKRGHAVTLQYSDSNLKSLNPASGSVSGIVGSDCPVPLTDFVYDRLESMANEAPRFLIRNFPTDEQLLLLTHDQRRVIIASPNGIVNVR